MDMTEPSIWRLRKGSKEILHFSVAIENIVPPEFHNRIKVAERSLFQDFPPSILSSPNANNARFFP